MQNKLFSKFETEIIIRPDDIDLNNHVHYSKYLDYLLTARYDQMRKDYKMTMEEFIDRGFTWVASDVSISYKRGLVLADIAIVQTQIRKIEGAQVEVDFWILRKKDMKLCSDGTVKYTMISIKNGRPVRIPEDIFCKYSI